MPRSFRMLPPWCHLCGPASGDPHPVSKPPRYFRLASPKPPRPRRCPRVAHEVVKADEICRRQTTPATPEFGLIEPNSAGLSNFSIIAIRSPILLESIQGHPVHPGVFLCLLSEGIGSELRRQWPFRELPTWPVARRLPNNIPVPCSRPSLRSLGYHRKDRRSDRCCGFSPTVKCRSTDALPKCCPGSGETR